MFKVAIAGCANVGKTSFFNLLTGKQNKVGNWEGVTVDASHARLLLANDIEIVDLPGLISIANPSRSADQIKSRDFLLEENIDLIVNIVSVEHIKRDLQLSVELYEIGKPILIVVLDHRSKASAFNLDFLGIDTIYVNLKIKGILREVIKKIKQSCYEKSAKSLRSSQEHCNQMQYHIDAGDKLIDTLISTAKDDPGKYSLINEARKDFVEDVLDNSPIYHSDRSITERIDKLLMHKFFALPAFILIICLVLFSTILGGSFLGRFFEFGAEMLIIKPVAHILKEIHAPQLLINTLQNGAGSGLKIISAFIPLLFLLYMSLGVIDESGYISRASITIGKISSKIGLPGKSIIPLIIGFGCNVPAIMGTRIIESEKQRLFTIILIPFMSCGARLTLFALFASAFFPQHGALIICGLYFFSIFLAVMVAIIIQPYFNESQENHRSLVMPKYKIPNIFVIFKHTLTKIKHFIMETGQTIIIISTVLYLLSIWPSSGVKGEPTEGLHENSVLVVASKKLGFVFKPIGIEENNWPATVSLLTGVIAKEVVASTLITLYTLQDHSSNDPKHLVQQHFKNNADAFAYVLFVLIYFPCISVFSTIKKETNMRVAVMSSIFYTLLAYLIAAIFHQISLHTNNSVPVALALLTALIAAVGTVARFITQKLLTRPL